MSTLPATPSPQPGGAADATAPQVTQESISWRERARSLNPILKGALLVLLVLVGIVWYVFTGRVSTDDAQVDCHITAMAPQVPGYVVQLLINDNTPVKEGDVLVQIDPRPYQAELDQAKANLDFAEAQANSAKLQITLVRETTTSSTSGATAQKDSDVA